ncbi:hypothetical protein XI06_21730 [Bradyrhizobium sp. CCBAU 11434]|nr:hypothetical protein [Bradyrhizobium sp. CCBAU 11434]
MSPPPSETLVRRLLFRAAKRRPRALLRSSIPHATDTDPNRELAQTEPTAILFFVFLSIFMLFYAIVEKMHVR